MIPYGRHYLDDADVEAVVDVLRHGPLTQGHHIEAFERSVAEYVGVKYAVAVSSGTAALHMAAKCLDLNEDSLLVTSPITFVATSNAALYVGAKVAFADVDPSTINIDPVCLDNTLRGAHKYKNTAIFPVHYAGLPCDMQAIKSVADKYGSVIVEDAAHALGARYLSGAMVGSCEHSSMTIFSFHPVKAIAAGEGGMITTNDHSLYKRLLRLRSHGINKGSDGLHDQAQAYTNGKLNPWYYEMQELGFHYRITDIQSALGTSQLQKLPEFLRWRSSLVARYDKAFAGMSRVAPAQLSGRSESAHHIYPVRIDFSGAGLSRLELMTLLREDGIGTQVHYLPVPMHPYYANVVGVNAQIPEAINFYNSALSLPLFYGLDVEKVDFVIDRLAYYLSS